MALTVTAGTKTVKQMIEVEVEVPTGEYTITLSEPQYRRLGRILRGHAGMQPVYHGPQTDAFAKELANEIGATTENTRPQ